LALTTLGYAGEALLITQEENGGDHHDRQHSKHHQSNREPVNFPHRENLAIEQDFSSLNCAR
jgi:hypothetical protein